MTDFSDTVAMVDTLKIEMFSRFRHLLQSIAALEARICELEDKRPNESHRQDPLRIICSPAPPWYKTHGLKGPPHHKEDER